LADRIRRAVQEGAYGPGQLIGSEHELARRENLARMTVRRASAVLINEGLIERRPGKGLFVRPNGVSTRREEIIVGNLQWEPAVQVSRGATAVARDRGIQAQLYDAHGDADQDLDMLRQLPESEAHGAVIVSLHNPRFNEAVCRLKLKGFPFVLVDQRLHDLDVPSVTADNHGGGYRIGQELLQRGHRRIAFIGNLGATTVQDRLAGLRDAIADAGLPFDRSMAVDLAVDRDPFGDWSEAIDGKTRETMTRANPPTAIFFSCDAVVRAAYRTLSSLGLSIPGEDLGLSIPGDVSVVGFDDDPLAEWLTPSLSTVRQPFDEMGRAAMELLCRLMITPGSAADRVALPVEFVPRCSISNLR